MGWKDELARKMHVLLQGMTWMAGAKILVTETGSFPLRPRSTSRQEVLQARSTGIERVRVDLLYRTNY